MLDWLVEKDTRLEQCICQSDSLRRGTPGRSLWGSNTCVFKLRNGSFQYMVYLEISLGTEAPWLKVSAASSQNLTCLNTSSSWWVVLTSSWMKPYGRFLHSIYGTRKDGCCVGLGTMKVGDCGQSTRYPGTKAGSSNCPVGAVLNSPKCCTQEIAWDRRAPFLFFGLSSERLYKVSKNPSFPIYTPLK